MARLGIPCGKPRKYLQLTRDKVKVFIDPALTTGTAQARTRRVRFFSITIALLQQLGAAPSGRVPWRRLLHGRCNRKNVPRALPRAIWHRLELVMEYHRTGRAVPVDWPAIPGCKVCGSGGPWTHRMARWANRIARSTAILARWKRV